MSRAPSDEFDPALVHAARSGDVALALIREGVVDKPPSGKGALKKVQAAFNGWMEESGRPLTQISRVLAFTVPVEGEEDAED